MNSCGNRFLPDFGALDKAGLNLQAVFDVESLPVSVWQGLPMDVSGFRQLILIGHGGRRLWQAMQESTVASDHPIDDFTVSMVRRWFASVCPGQDFALLYPGDAPVGLQQLGKLAGWHRPSPLMLGIRPGWGTWFAYRAVLLTDTDFSPTPPLQEVSPCEACAPRSCIEACPAGALAGESFQLDKCIAYRKCPDSLCRTTCLARLACPVGAEHRYCEAQMQHTYSISMAAIEAYC